MPKALRAGAGIARRPAERSRVLEQMQQAAYGRDHAFLPIERVSPNPRNPRQQFSEEAINALAASIKEWGQLQPVLVRRLPDHYELIAGERRWRAVRRAGLETIWAVERDASDVESFKLALVENLHREELSHAETVAALDQLAELSEASGLNRTAHELRVSPTWLSLRLSVRKDPVVFPALETGKLSFSQAIELRRAPAHARRGLLDRTLQKRAGHRVIREWVDQVRALERRSRSGISASVALSSETDVSSARDHPGPADQRGDEHSGVPIDDDSYASVLTRLRTIGPPRTDEDRATVEAIASLITSWSTPVLVAHGPSALPLGRRSSRQASTAD